VQAHARQYEWALAALASRGVYAPRPIPHAIEIGAGQGTACAALAKLGFETTAIDNDYDGAMDSGAALAAAVAQAAAVRVRFARADITRRTSFDDGEFDLAISNSVLEHIADLRAAFREMARILAPGGVAIHRYHPFFGPTGGHAFGTLDSPWAHVRLTARETERYLDALRPHEAPLAKPWIAQALNRDWPIARVQAALGACGLELLAWTETPASPSHLRGLDGASIADALTRNPGISLADLATDTVEFVCRRMA
jgi:SAM-dependent methyltransferase